MASVRAQQLIKQLLRVIPVLRSQGRHSNVPAAGARSHEGPGPEAHGQAAATARLLWRERGYAVKLFEEHGPERARSEAMLLAAGVTLPVGHPTGGGVLPPQNRPWVVR